MNWTDPINAMNAPSRKGQPAAYTPVSLVNTHRKTFERNKKG